MTEKNYWLMKSEPNEFSIDDLIKQPKQTEFWDGVRNYQARNMMRDQMQKGDEVFFYHSNCDVPGIVGRAKVVKTGYPDITALDPDNKHYDPKSTADNPRWYGVDIKFVKKFPEVLPLTMLKTLSELKDFALTRKGNRLSVMPVSEHNWHCVLALVE